MSACCACAGAGRLSPASATAAHTVNPPLMLMGILSFASMTSSPLVAALQVRPLPRSLPPVRQRDQRAATILTGSCTEGAGPLKIDHAHDLVLADAGAQIAALGDRPVLEHKEAVRNRERQPDV